MQILTLQRSPVVSGRNKKLMGRLSARTSREKEGDNADNDQTRSKHRITISPGLFLPGSISEGDEELSSDDEVGPAYTWEYRHVVCRTDVLVGYNAARR